MTIPMQLDFCNHRRRCESSISCFHIKSVANRFVPRFKFLGVPLLGEENGVLAIQESFPTWTEWLPYERFPPGSDDHRIMDTVRQCFASASMIYIQRAMHEDKTITNPLFVPAKPAELPAIQELVDCLSCIPPTSTGAHALVWVCFVAGAETCDPVQRQFFADYMLGIYSRTKFANIPAAVESLQRIWARTNKKRWTQCLSELSNVLVM